MNITGNTIFVPGGTSGIGLALALRLQARGNTVVVGGRRTELLAELAQQGLGTAEIDVSDPDSIAAATTDVLARYPDLNVLVTMAGIMRVEDWRTPAFLADAEDVVITNVLGTIRLIAALIDQLQTRPDAAIVTVSSGLAHAPLRATPTYNATKAAIHMLSETLRLQLTGVQVVELVPPSVRTALIPDHQNDPTGMPLDEFADEAIGLLEADAEVTEVLVDRVKFLRFGEVRGDYDQVVATLNGAAAHA